MYQFRQIQATTWWYPCNHFDKSKTMLNYLSNIQNEEWQPDLVTRQCNDRICRTNHTFFLKRLYIRIRCDLHFSLQSSSDTRKWRNLSNERFIVCKKLCSSFQHNGRKKSKEDGTSSWEEWSIWFKLDLIHLSKIQPIWNIIIYVWFIDYHHMAIWWSSFAVYKSQDNTNKWPCNVYHHSTI